MRRRTVLQSPTLGLIALALGIGVIACRVDNPDFDPAFGSTDDGTTGAAGQTGLPVVDSDGEAPSPAVGGSEGSSGSGAEDAEDPPDAPCPLDSTWCGDACVDVLGNEQHCGGCDSPCAVGDLCDAGSCVAGCGDDRQLCGVECVDTTKSEDHCGGCDNECPAWAWCSDGICDCFLSGVVCGDECVDTRNDAAHCGDCDQPCNQGEECSDGECL